jgi:hypothetical protein
MSANGLCDAHNDGRKYARRGQLGRAWHIIPRLADMPIYDLVGCEPFVETVSKNCYIHILCVNDSMTQDYQACVHGSSSCLSVVSNIDSVSPRQAEVSLSEL